MYIFAGESVWLSLHFLINIFTYIHTYIYIDTYILYKHEIATDT